MFAAAVRMICRRMMCSRSAWTHRRSRPISLMPIQQSVLWNVSHSRCLTVKRSVPTALRKDDLRFTSNSRPATHRQSAMPRPCGWTRRMLIAVMLSAIAYVPTEVLGGVVTFPSGQKRMRAHLAQPAGDGPFPVVVYLHGGRGQAIGGDPQKTAAALAKSGFLGFAPIRDKDPGLTGNIQGVVAALNYVKGLQQADPSRVALIGFSRGGLLAFMAATRRRDLKAIVMMAPAEGRGVLRRFLADARRVNVRTLILVARNDTRQADHVSISRQIHSALQTAGKQSRLVVYPPFGKDGHQLFFQVRASYWRDVEQFLKEHL